MSVRLNVVLVQSAQMSGLQSGINQELVMQLIGSPGLDLAIVSSLDRATASETDRLLLSSLQSDLAVLDWRDSDDVIRTLADSGLTGSRSPHRLDPDVLPVEAGQRRIYVVDLRRGDRPSDVVEALRDLLSQRRVVAVPIVLNRSAKPADKADATEPRAVEPANRSMSATDEVGSDRLSPTTTQVTKKRTADTAEAASPPQRPADATSDRELDALVDDVNDAHW